MPLLSWQRPSPRPEIVVQAFLFPCNLQKSKFEAVFLTWSASARRFKEVGDMNLPPPSSPPPRRRPLRISKAPPSTSITSQSPTSNINVSRVLRPLTSNNIASRAVKKPPPPPINRKAGFPRPRTAGPLNVNSIQVSKSYVSSESIPKLTKRYSSEAPDAEATRIVFNYVGGLKGQRPEMLLEVLTLLKVRTVWKETRYGDNKAKFSDTLLIPVLDFTPTLDPYQAVNIWFVRRGSVGRSSQFP